MVCINILANLGAGHPDFGLFTQEQVRKGSKSESLYGHIPERGVVEVKSPSESVAKTAETKQIEKYWERYRQVLITNYWEFLLLGENGQGERTVLDYFCLAENEQSFLAQVRAPRGSAGRNFDQFNQFLQRVMRFTASLHLPKDVAWFLSSFARDALRKVETSDLQALEDIREALEIVLDIKFEGTKGKHFFHSSLVQTLFYGVFAAWVLWCGKGPSRKEKFDWRSAEWSLNVPVIQDLFSQITAPNKLRPIGLVDILDRASEMLNRVDRPAFFAQFNEGWAIQYFYEPFLEAFDPKLRKELGIWYTPPEIVKYMVTRVDMVLQEHLGILDGLADSRVLILDPCCGTGAFLVEALAQIAEKLAQKGGDALTANELKKAALERVRGFEILPAPFVVAHLQIGMLLRRMGIPFTEGTDERAGVFLANALTGTSADRADKRQLVLALDDEQKKADKVKMNEPILVVLGNPPYNAYAGVSPKEEGDLVKPYKEGLAEKWGVKKYNLDDSYIRFFRFAERRIVERTGKGVVCLISNFSYLSGASFTVMRERLLQGFDRFWFDCLNGDSRETGKLTPDGRPDPSVFSTEMNKAGIRVGTAIGLMVRKSPREEESTVLFRHFWGASKRNDLVSSLEASDIKQEYAKTVPKEHNRFDLRPYESHAHYSNWPLLTELGAEPPINGLMEKRGGALFNSDKSTLQKRIQLYFDRDVGWEQLKLHAEGLTKNAARFEARHAREKLLSTEHYDDSRIVPYSVRPFDVRWCYYTGVRPIWNEPRPSLWQQFYPGNDFIVARPAGVTKPEGAPISYTNCLGDNDSMRGHAYYISFWNYGDLAGNNTQNEKQVLFPLNEGKSETRVANLSPETCSYLSKFGFASPDSEQDIGSLIWLHALAIGYSPAYLAENRDGRQHDWPRIPLPKSKERLLESASLGRQVKEYLDTERQLPGVSSRDIRSDLQCIGVITRAGGGNLDPEDGELAATAGWGNRTQQNVVMPGKGRIVERAYSQTEKESLAEGWNVLGLVEKAAFEQYGEKTLDVYLNDVAYWANIPKAVWEYRIGGYQVIKKWLSYREKSVLGRSMNAEEVREVTEMARRITALVLLQPALDENYGSSAEFVGENGVCDPFKCYIHR